MRPIPALNLSGIADLPQVDDGENLPRQGRGEQYPNE
jgi:hypothetical protein